MGDLKGFILKSARARYHRRRYYGFLALGLLFHLLAGYRMFAEESALSINDGIRRHDAGDYDGAIGVYEKLLHRDPQDTHVLYEMAFSLMAKGTHREAIQTIEKGLALSPSNAHEFYMLLGACHDELGEWSKGEEAFRKGLERSPGNHLLLFNLGVNQAGRQKHEAAVEILQKAIKAKQDHPGSWLKLGTSLEATGWRARAFGCYARFLTLEPRTERAKGVAARMWPLLFMGVEKKNPTEKGNKTQVVLELPPDLGDPVKAAEGASLGLVAAVRYTEKSEEKSEAVFFVHALDDVLKILSELHEKTPNDFCGTYLLAYFDEARKKKHLEALAYEIRSSLSDPEITAWLESHVKEVEKFRRWSQEWRPKELS